MIVRDGRPYPPTGLTTALWQHVPLRFIRYADLTTVQAHIRIDALLRPRRDDPPLVVEHDGTLYLEDGHTRVTRRLLDGYQGGMCRVYTITAAHLTHGSGTVASAQHPLPMPA